MRPSLCSQSTSNAADMIINYATEKGLKLDESPKEVIEYIGSIDSEDIDVEMTPEMLASVSGGGKLRPKGNTRRTTGQKIFYFGLDEPRHSYSVMSNRLSLKVPATTGAFYFLSHTYKPTNQPPIISMRPMRK